MGLLPPSDNENRSFVHGQVKELAPSNGLLTTCHPTVIAALVRAGHFHTNLSAPAPAKVALCTCAATVRYRGGVMESVRVCQERPSRC
jgi:hypothetical protein